MRLLRLPAAFLSLLLLALPGHAAPEAALENTLLMNEEAQWIVRLLEQGHYANRQLKPEDFREMLERYLEALDGRRMFFTQVDRTAILDRYGSDLPERMRMFGMTEPAYDIYRLYENRVRARSAWVRERLQQEFRFDDEATFRIDRTEEPWPADAAAADDLWERRLRAEMLDEILADKTEEEARATILTRYERFEKSLDDIEAQELHEAFLSSLMQVYDPHSTFFSATTLEDFSIQIRQQLIGIGALLGQEDGFCTIRELVPGGPAKLSGLLRPNDRILAVRQEGGEAVEVTGLRLRRVVNLIRGERGTPVYLLVQPAGTTDAADAREIALVRDVIRLNEGRARASVEQVPQADGSTLPVGVISIPSFYGAEANAEGGQRVSVTADVRELLGKLREAGAQSIVLDFRRNGGGLLNEAIDLAGLFIPRGPVVQVRDGADRVVVRSDNQPDIVWDGPLVVLTDRFTASASEIVAGALRDHGRAVLVGTSSTHGKGSVQQVFELAGFMDRSGRLDGRVGAAKITVQKFYLPSGDSTQNRGVVPDIILPSVEDLLPVGESELPHALPWDNVRPARYTPLTGRDALVARLRVASDERRAALEEFAFLQSNIDAFRLQRDRDPVSLNIQTRRQQRETDRELRTMLRQRSVELAETNFASTALRLDGVEPEEEEPVAAGPEDGEETTPEDELPFADFDVHLREGVRVAADLARFAHTPAAEPVITAQTPATTGR